LPHNFLYDIINQDVYAWDEQERHVFSTSLEILDKTADAERTEGRIIGNNWKSEWQKPVERIQ